MRDDFAGLGAGQAIVHPEREVGGQLRRLAIGDKRADGDEAAVARREIGSQPQIFARIPQMDWFPADLLEPFVKGIQRLAQQEASSFCFHPLHPP